MEQLTDLHYFHLPSQGNIYTMTSLEVANGPHKILVASLKREIFCVEFQETTTGFIPTAKEVSFTYIPSGAEIISIDAFNRSPKKNDFVIGITIIKNNNNLDSLEFYLNIYSEWEESKDFNIESIAQNCLNVELSFTPYQLTHTDLIIWENDEIISKEVVFLLSGNDNQIHVYREYAMDHVFKELENKEYFPEFAKIPSPVVWTDIYFNEDCSQRITALACECGYVRLAKVCIKTGQLVFNFSTKFDNYISHICIYLEDEGPNLVRDLQPSKSPDRVVLNVVVVNTILPPVLFEDVLTYGLSKYFSFPRHDFTCVFTCCKVADIDFDGEKEILMGSSAQEVVLYKKDRQKGWCLEEAKMFSSPIIKVRYVDVIGDGVNELVILSTRGVHFLQHDFAHVQRVLREKMTGLDLSNFACLKL